VRVHVALWGKQRGVPRLSFSHGGSEAFHETASGAAA
jgi:hypothetical protein